MIVVLIDAGLVGAFVVAVKEILGKLGGELAGAEERLRVDKGWRQNLGVAVLAGVEVEHEVGEGAFETCSLAEVDDEAGARDFCGAVEVEDAERFAELPVGFGGEVELRLFAPDFFFAIAMLVFADGHAVLRQIRAGSA